MFKLQVYHQVKLLKIYVHSNWKVIEHYDELFKLQTKNPTKHPVTLILVFK